MDFSTLVEVRSRGLLLLAVQQRTSTDCCIFFFRPFCFHLVSWIFLFSATRKPSARKMIKYLIQLIAWGYVCLLYSLQHVHFYEISAKPGSTNLRMDPDTAGVLHHKDKHGKQYYTTTSALWEHVYLHRSTVCISVANTVVWFLVWGK